MGDSLQDCFFTMHDDKRALKVEGANSIDNKAYVVSNDITEFVKQGRLYTIQRIFPILAAATKYFLFDCSGVTPNPPVFIGNVIGFPFAFGTDFGPVNVKLYADTDYNSAGTIVPLVNRNEKSSNVAQTIIKEDPTGSSKGTFIFEYLVGTAGALPVTTGGGKAEMGAPFIIDCAKKRLLEVINNSGDNINFEIRFLLAEF